MRNKEEVLLMVGNGLKERRIALGITQRQMAKRMGITPATLCNFEQGKRDNLFMALTYTHILAKIEEGQ